MKVGTMRKTERIEHNLFFYSKLKLQIINYFFQYTLLQKKRKNFANIISFLIFLFQPFSFFIFLFFIPSIFPSANLFPKENFPHYFPRIGTKNKLFFFLSFFVVFGRDAARMQHLCRGIISE